MSLRVKLIVAHPISMNDEAGDMASGCIYCGRVFLTRKEMDSLSVSELMELMESRKHYAGCPRTHAG